MSKSQFDRGLIYNLVLFAEHAERNVSNIHEIHNATFEQILQNPRHAPLLRIWETKEAYLAEAIFHWASPASDHLEELIIPKRLPKELQEKILKLQQLLLNMGKGLMQERAQYLTMDNYTLAQELLKAIARELDIFFKIESAEADIE